LIHFYKRFIHIFEMSEKKVLVILAKGAEEMETVISVDVLRRGGLDVVLAGLDNDEPALCSRNVKICPDTSLTKAASQGPFDCIVLPGGGPGAAALCESKEVGVLLSEQDSAGRLLAAVCAAPTALAAHSIGQGKKVTSYPAPAFKEKLISAGYLYQDGADMNVVVDGNIITSRGPGTSFQFALEIVKMLCSEEKSKEVASAMLVNF